MAAGAVIKSLFDLLVSVEARWLCLLAARNPASDSSLLTTGSTRLVKRASPACACWCRLTAVGRHRTLFTWTSRARGSGASSVKPAGHKKQSGWVGPLPPRPPWSVFYPKCYGFSQPYLTLVVGNTIVWKVFCSTFLFSGDHAPMSPQLDSVQFQQQQQPPEPTFCKLNLAKLNLQKEHWTWQMVKPPKSWPLLWGGAKGSVQIKRSNYLFVRCPFTDLNWFF